MRDDCPVSRNCIEKQTRVLRLAEARGISIALLSAETGIPDQTLRSYVDKPSRPASLMSWAVLVKLLKALPDDLANLLMEDSDYVLKPREAKDRNWMGLAAEASGFASKVCAKCRDSGRVDHRAEIELVDELRHFVADAEAELGPMA